VYILFFPKRLIKKKSFLKKKLASKGGLERREHIGLQSIFCFCPTVITYKNLISYTIMVSDLLKMLSVFVEVLHRWTDGGTKRL